MAGHTESIDDKKARAVDKAGTASARDRHAPPAVNREEHDDDADPADIDIYGAHPRDD